MAQTELDILIAKLDEYRAKGMTKLVAQIEKAIKNAANKEVVVNTKQGSVTKPKESNMPIESIKDGYRLVLKTCTNRSCHEKKVFQTNAPRGKNLSPWYCTNHSVVKDDMQLANDRTEGRAFLAKSKRELLHMAYELKLRRRTKMNASELFKALQAA